MILKSSSSARQMPRCTIPKFGVLFTLVPWSLLRPIELPPLRCALTSLMHPYRLFFYAAITAVVLAYVHQSLLSLFCQCSMQCSCLLPWQTGALHILLKGSHSGKAAHIMCQPSQTWYLLFFLLHLRVAVLLLAAVTAVALAYAYESDYSAFKFSFGE